MAPLRFRRLVSFSSEDKDKPASGLLSSKKWCCQDPGESSAWVTLELDGLAKISSIDVGNYCSAFVEVQVSRSGSSNFKPLLSTSAFLNMAECRSMEHAERVRMFSEDKLDPFTSKESWDVLKFICTQPFNKRVRYGLNFVTVNGVLDSKATVAADPVPPTKLKKIGSILLNEEESGSIKNGSLFLQRQSAKKATPQGDGGSLMKDMQSKESLASLSLAISQRREKEENDQRSRKKVEEENDERRKARKRKLEAIHQLPSRNQNESTNDVSSNQEEANVPSKKKKDKKTIKIVPSKIEKESPRAEAAKTAPFKKLLSGVVFTISGFQNPLRSEIRSKALSMGAAYVGDWNSTCTHLVCAFSNTPKFNQVKSLGGKIVKKEWIEDSARGKRRSHWRKYALDPQDEHENYSDEELLDETTMGPSTSTNEPQNAVDTDEEIELVRQFQNKRPPKEEDGFSDETDKEDASPNQESADEDYNADTDADAPVKKEDELDFPELPDYFENLGFYFYGPLPDEDSIKRIIVRAGGSLFQYMDPGVKFVVSEKSWDDNFDEAVKVNPKMRFVVPEYIMKCFEANEKLPTKHYRTVEPTE